MIHVKKRDLLLLFAQHEKHGVKELRQFRQKVDVDASRDLERRAKSEWKPR